MRRRPGIAGIHQRRDTTAAIRTVGEEASERSLETMRRQLATFRQSLEEFALRHKADIRRDPAFRAQFHKMCANCGVDPLASNKGFWAELLGFGDFYYELGVQIADPRSMRAWLKSPGRSVSTRARAVSKSALRSVPSSPATRPRRHRTRWTFPSMTGSTRAKAMEATAPAV